MSDQWTRDLAQKLRDRRQRQSIRDASFLEKQKLKRRLGPPLWAEVKASVSTRCTELNMEMGEPVLTFNPSPSHQISVDAQTGDLMQGGSLGHLAANFDVETGKARYDSGNYQGSFELTIDNNGNAQFYSGMIPATPDSMAREMVGSLFQ
jgi:hypothetical protein